MNTVLPKKVSGLNSSAELGIVTVQSETNFATCSWCYDQNAQTCASNQADSTSCLQEDYYSVEATANAYGTTYTFDMCSNTSGCDDSQGLEDCLECDAGDSEICNACTYGSYLDYRNECTECIDDCRVCSDEDTCESCDYFYYYDGTDKKCTYCSFESDYFFECIASDGVDDTGISTCTVCIDTYVVTYDKTIYDLSSPDSVSSETVTECLGHCPAYQAPTFAKKDNSPNLVSSSACEPQAIEDSDDCY